MPGSELRRRRRLARSRRRSLDIPYHLVLLVLEPGDQLKPLIAVSQLTRISRRKLKDQLDPPIDRPATLTYVLLATVQDDLVHPLAPPNLLQRIDDLQSQLPPLHGLGHRDVFDMPDKARVADKLALYNDRAACYDLLVSLGLSRAGRMGLALSVGLCTMTIVK